jgi:hypothetical protein
MSEHAPLPPSGAAAWVKCHYWPTLNAKYPQDNSPETIEGEAAHWAGAELIEGRQIALGQVTPSGYVLDAEMVEAAEMYAADVASVEGKPTVENRVAMPYIHEQNWGTPDCYKWPTPYHLVLWDFKYGHKFVPAFENWQLIDYSAGLTSPFNGLDDQALTVEFRIVQPRNYHALGPIRIWRTTAGELRGHYNQLQAAASHACGLKPRATVGEHCEYCPGRHVCNAAQAAAYTVADITLKGAVIDLPPSALGLELRNLKRAALLLESRITGLEVQALNTITRGQAVPFFEVQHEYGRLAWTQPPESIFALGDVLGVDLRKPPAPITPTQAKKLIDGLVISAYSDKPKGAAKLVASDISNARQVFGHNLSEELNG